MSRFLKIKGENSEEKFKHLEVILKRFSRRLHKTIITAVPPCPIFSWIEKPAEDGTIMKCAMPTDGEISKVCIVISHYEGKSSASFTVEISHFDIYGVSPGRISASFETKKNVIVENISLPVKVGDCLTISTSTPEAISGIWTTLLYHIDPIEGKLQELSIDNLDKLIEEKLDEGV